MADFVHVHRRALGEAKRALQERRSDRWNIALEEPLRFDAPMSETATFITVCIGGDGKIHPINGGSLEAVRDWKERHKDTPNESFEFPNIAGARK